MSLNKRTYLYFAAALSSLFLLCSRSDVITGVGGGVVSDMDSTLTDMKGGFTPITLGADDAAEHFSLPAAADPAFSTQFMPYIYVGISDDGDTLAAHIQYRAPAFTDEKFSYIKEDTLKGAYLYFQADDTLALPDSITIFPSEPLVGLSPVDRSDKEKNAFIVGGGKEGDDEDGEDAEDGEDVNGGEIVYNTIGSFELGAAGKIDSIPLPESLANEIFATRVSREKDSVCLFAFSIVDYHGKLRKIRNPYVVLRIARKGISTPVRDSIPGDSRFTAFENEAAQERAGYAFSSQHTLRTAVFKVSMDRLFDDLKVKSGETVRSELINAVLAVKADGKSNGVIAAANAGNYRAVVLDRLVTDEMPADVSVAAVRNSLRHHFSIAPSIALSPQGGSQSIKTSPGSNPDTSVKDILGKPRGPGETYIYIYLRPVSDHGNILWDKPSIETIFTPSRSQ